MIELDTMRQFIIDAVGKSVSGFAVLRFFILLFTVFYSLDSLCIDGASTPDVFFSNLSQPDVCASRSVDFNIEHQYGNPVHLFGSTELCGKYNVCSDNRDIFAEHAIWVCNVLSFADDDVIYDNSHCYASGSFINFNGKKCIQSASLLLDLCESSAGVYAYGDDICNAKLHPAVRDSSSTCSGLLKRLEYDGMYRMLLVDMLVNINNNLVKMQKEIRGKVLMFQSADDSVFSSIVHLLFVLSSATLMHEGEKIAPSVLEEFRKISYFVVDKSTACNDVS